MDRFLHTIEKPLQTIVNAGKTIVDMAAASTSSGILGDIVAKGPTTESQFAYKACKIVYKKLIAYCTPFRIGTSQGTFTMDHP